MKMGKMFFNKFSGICRINPIGIRVKVTFYPICFRQKLSVFSRFAYCGFTNVYFVNTCLFFRCYKS